ncbi:MULTISPECIES: OsmC family protein [Nocardioides]|uniref:OsmC family protein n=1 Tax=Nocardioides vastitatis TaxID=2568655 RepID=A0ABW0ZCM4_9ACTN|nr:OsmC family protein [Nocardioides sp.]THI93479.1 OsmC family protein [Nocardioides sp.]
MTTIQETRSKFTDDPAAAKTAPKVTATLNNGFARLSAGPFNWDSDLPAPLGGGNTAPSPTAYLLGALAGCAVAFVNDVLAPEFDVEIDDVTATAGCSADLAGLVGVPGTDPRLQAMTLEVQISSGSPAENIASLEQAWRERCPVLLALTDAVPVDVRFT